MNVKAPIFSVIIPTRNRSALLRKCVESVIRQKFQDWELIVIDDGSEDDTAELVKGFVDERIQYYFQEHKERSSARNHGIVEASGRYVCFIDDDDYVLDNYLQDFYDYYEANGFPDIIVRTGFVRKDGDKEKFSTSYNERKHKNPVDYVLQNMCGIGSLSIPISVLGTKRFPIQFPHWQDTHLFVRLLLETDLFQLDSSNYIYLIHEEMGSKKATIDFNPLERVELNIDAMEHLFEIEREKIYEYVSRNTLSYLKAEKYLDYASNVSNRKEVLILLRKSLSSGFYISLSKKYCLATLKLLLI